MFRALTCKVHVFIKNKPVSINGLRRERRGASHHLENPVLSDLHKRSESRRLPSSMREAKRHDGFASRRTVKNVTHTPSGNPVESAWSCDHFGTLPNLWSVRIRRSGNDSWGLRLRLQQIQKEWPLANTPNTSFIPKVKLQSAALSFNREEKG